MNHSNQKMSGEEHCLGDTNLVRGGGGGRNNFSTYENVNICNNCHVSDIFRNGSKILQVG